MSSLFPFKYLIGLLSLQLLFCSAILAKNPLELVIKAGDDAFSDQIFDAIKQPFQVASLTFDSDVYFQKDEFLYLVDLKVGTPAGAKEVERAVAHLLKKNKFERIVITITPLEVGSQVHFALQGFWTFCRLKLHGMLLGKDAYRQYYLIEPGEVFDETKHQRSLERIKEAFACEGYFDGTLESEIKRDELTRSITVDLYLCKGNAFCIGDLHTEIRKTSSIQKDESAGLLEKLEAKFFKRIRKGYYNKQTLTTQTGALKRYLAKLGFAQVSIELREHINRKKNNVDLTFILELNQRKEFVFVGNRFFSDDLLLDNLMLFGSSAWFLPASILRQEVSRLYKQKGFWNVVVDEREEADRSFFLIQEGERASVNNVVLKNVKKFESEALVSKFFSSFLKLKYFDEQAFEKALDALESYYHSQGFLDFAVVKRTFEGESKPTVHTAVVTVQEGEQSFFVSVTIPDYVELQEQGPFLAFKQRVGPVPFDMQLVHEQRKWLVEHFQKDGYCGVVVTPDIVIKEAGNPSTPNGYAASPAKLEAERGGLRPKGLKENNVSVVWQVQPGESKICFGKTIIQGSSTIPFNIIARELAYEEGDVWDKEKVKGSLVRLRSLDVFESISLHPHDSSASEVEKTMILKLQKDDPFELRLRGGFAAQQMSRPLSNTGITYRAGGSFFIKNPFNRGDQIRFDADIDKSQRSFTAQYQLPWFFNRPIKTTFQGYSSKYLQPAYIKDKKNLYEVTQQGGLIGFAKKKGAHDFGVTFGLEFMETNIGRDCGEDKFGHGIAHAINFAPQLLDKKIPYVMAEPTWIIDFVDNRPQPTRGSFSLLSAKAMIPFSTIDCAAYLVRFLVEQSFYVPLRSLVFAFRARVGHIFHEKLATIMPSERFYLGGANSIRSYDTDRCPPMGSFVDCEGHTRFVPQGGKTMVNVNFEMRIPVYKNMAAVVFQDLGGLRGDTPISFRQEGILAATGCGLRYNTPIGPLRFDVGWNWHKAYPEQPRYAWFLTLGNAF